MLKIHFLNVGHGDCTLIEFPSGRTTLVDINNSKVIDKDTENELRSLSTNFDMYREQGYKLIDIFKKSVTDFVEPVDPVDYIKENLNNPYDIFRFILTHPDMDHMSGLYKLKDENINIGNFWDTDNQKVVVEKDVIGKFDFRDWETYKNFQKSDSNPKVLNILKGEQRSYFDDDGIDILSPTKEIIQTANETKNWNLLSYILIIEYAGHKIVLGGDADTEVWDELADTDKDLLRDVSILKASHHGRNSGYSSKAVSIMQPDWTICSVGKKPSQDSSNKYRAYTKEKVLSTRFRGNIVVEISSDGDLKMYSEDNHNEDDGIYPL